MEMFAYRELSKETIKQMADCIRKRYAQCGHEEVELSYSTDHVVQGITTLRCLNCDSILVFDSKALNWGKSKLEEKA